MTRRHRLRECDVANIQVNQSFCATATGDYVCWARRNCISVGTTNARVDIADQCVDFVWLSNDYESTLQFFHSGLIAVNVEIFAFRRQGQTYIFYQCVRSSNVSIAIQRTYVFKLERINRFYFYSLLLQVWIAYGTRRNFAQFKVDAMTTPSTSTSTFQPWSAGYSILFRPRRICYNCDSLNNRSSCMPI